MQLTRSCKVQRHLSHKYTKTTSLQSRVTSTSEAWNPRVGVWGESTDITVCPFITPLEGFVVGWGGGVALRCLISGNSLPARHYTLKGKVRNIGTNKIGSHVTEDQEQISVLPTSNTYINGTLIKFTLGGGDLIKYSHYKGVGGGRLLCRGTNNKDTFAVFFLL